MQRNKEKLKMQLATNHSTGRAFLSAVISSGRATCRIQNSSVARLNP